MKSWKRHNDTPWDGEITICLDIRRCKYAAAEIPKKCKSYTKPYTFAARLAKQMADNNILPSYAMRWKLEKYYRWVCSGQITDEKGLL